VLTLTAGQIALAIALLLLLALLALYASGVGRRANLEPEGVPTGNPSMERKVVVTLAMMLLSGLLLLGYGIWEPTRQAIAQDRQENISIKRGIEEYTSLCIGCHGIDGQGAVVPGSNPPIVAPQLNREDLRPKDPEAYRERYAYVNRVLHRGRGTIMPAWGREDGGTLLDEQIHELTLLITKGDKVIEGNKTAWEVAREVSREKIAHGAPEPEQPTLVPPADLSEDAKAGQRLLTGKGACVGCHVVQTVGGATGPNLNGIGTRAAERKPGLDAAAYIRESIRQPQAFITPGYAPLMPAYTEGQLSDQEVNQIIEYLLTLK
jgi:mono/diheme cytochrome c family protein